jgi:hypothetical protein
VDDAIALRVEQVKLALGTFQQVCDLRARRHLAIFGVAIAAAASAAVAVIVRQVAPDVGAFPIAAFVVVAGRELAALDQLERVLSMASEEANAALESLKVLGGEQHGDDRAAERA